MRQTPAALAMRQFVKAAIEAAGGQRQVTELLAEAGILEGEKPYSQTGISGWATGRTEKVPAEPLWALAALLDLSMDLFALGRRTSMEERMRRLEVQQDAIRERLEEFLSDRGERPLEIPNG